MSRFAHLLPSQVHVFVRDWLSSNNVLIRSRDGHVLIDTGYARHAPLTLQLIASPRGLDGEPLAKIVNTHGHSDHIGGNAALIRAYDCPVAVPSGEAPLIERWDTIALLVDYCDQQAERFEVSERLPPGASQVWGDLEWRALAAPGHDMGALVFYNPEHRILVSGDALWENGFGFVMPPEIDPLALPAARATLDMLATLDVAIVVPGHGEPFTDFAAALERAYNRIEAFEGDSLRMARHALKVNLSFALLDKRRMRLADLPAYLARVGLYRDFNAQFFGVAPAKLAEMLVHELRRAGAIRIESGEILPTAVEAG